MEIAFLCVGLIAGGAVGFLIASNRKKGEMDRSEIEAIQEQLTTAKIEKATLSERVNKSLEVYNQQNKELSEVQVERSKLQEINAITNAKNEFLEEKLNTQKDEIEKIQKEFALQFENIANKILEEKSTKFTEKNKENIGAMLDPLGLRIKEFEKKVEETYIRGTKERSALAEQIKLLSNLNEQMSADAQNLTNALKGDAKQQGNWGEMILDRILESSGLIKNQEYLTQVSALNEAGQRIQPDVVIQLPDAKHVIIDSKVSLTAYERYVNCKDEEEASLHLKAHLVSVKKHVKELSEKNYQHAKEFNSPDFVLLFIPIESCFSIAIQEDHELYNYAWKHKIVIVSPSTLLATLRTIASVWKQERQNKNAEEIARQAGALYDKFVGFIGDMEQIKKGIKTSDDAYDKAMSKLSTGNGNLVRSSEKIRKLGAKSNKRVPEKLIEELKKDVLPDE